MACQRTALKRYFQILDARVAGGYPAFSHIGDIPDELHGDSYLSKEQIYEEYSITGPGN